MSFDSSKRKDYRPFGRFIWIYALVVVLVLVLLARHFGVSLP